MSRKNSPEYGHLTKDKYENGLSSEEWRRWKEICTQKGRIPFIDIPQLCVRCGQVWPEMFMVQNKVWLYYTNPELKNEMLCLDCFQEIRQKVDQYNERPEWLPSNEEIEAFIKAWRTGDREMLRILEPEKFTSHFGQSAG